MLLKSNFVKKKYNHKKPNNFIETGWFHAMIVSYLIVDFFLDAFGIMER